MMEMIRPRRLQPGDTVGIASPASWGDPERTKAAAAVLERLGLNVRFGEGLIRRHGYLAGTDEERAAELNEMFADPAIRAIVCARGGYGTGRIADLLDYELIRANPKIFWGYSDITFLHAAIGKLAGLVTFHGPMLIDLVREDEAIHPLTLQAFEALVRPAAVRYTEEISPLRTLVEGVASGPLAGGNISLIASTLGTPYELDTKGRLLFLEEVDEEPYRLDRLLNQLRQAGKFEDAAGILVCDFSNCVPGKRKESLTMEEVVRDHIASAGKPTLAGFRVGHCSPNVMLPVGVRAELDATRRTLTGMEAGIEE